MTPFDEEKITFYQKLPSGPIGREYTLLVMLNEMEVRENFHECFLIKYILDRLNEISGANYPTRLWKLSESELSYLKPGTFYYNQVLFLIDKYTISIYGIGIFDVDIDERYIELDPYWNVPADQKPPF